MFYEIQRICAFLTGFAEFRSDYTRAYFDYGLIEAYDLGREFAHFITLGMFEGY